MIKPLVASLVLLCGCSVKLHYAGKNFEPSQSMCVDSLLVNMDVAGCDTVYYGYSQSRGAFKVRCVSFNEKLSDDEQVLREWTTYSFFVSPSFAPLPSESDLIPICSDRNATIYFLDEDSQGQ